MATTTQHAPGTFCWPELATTDPEGAKKFYGALFGWDTSDTPIGENEFYTMVSIAGRNVGALYTMSKDERANGIPPHWNAYVSVESADHAAAQAGKLGGKVLMQPFDVMEHGRMAVIQDPTGAVFCVWQAKAHPGAGVLDEPGSLTWTELLTTDTSKAGAFYTGLFGWGTETMPMTMVPGATYTMFKRGEAYAGGMMPITPQMGPIPPNWMSYFAVADVDAAAAKAARIGAKIHMPPTDIPNIGRFAVLADPQGAAFAIYKSANPS